MSPDGSNGPSLLRAGDQLGPYKVIRLLGAGGMGEVYEVVHRDLGSHFAIKRIHPDLLKRGEGSARFRREAQVMARLAHANIVHVDDFQQADGEAWLRMELIQGGSLADRMRALKGSAMQEEAVCEVIRQTLSALDYAHAQGVVHRDLKPANILLEGGHTVKITDFGLVGLADPDWLESRLRSTTQAPPSMGELKTRMATSGDEPGRSLLGTFAYMSPEQKQGQKAGPQSDLYAVGLMAFQLLTGEESPGFKQPSKLNPHIAEEWDRWLEQAMETKPGRRFRSARQMLEQMPDPSGRKEASETGIASRRPRRLAVFALLAVATALTMVGAWHYLDDWLQDLRTTRMTTEEPVAPEIAPDAEESAAGEATVSMAPLNLRIEPVEPSTRVWLGDHSGLGVDSDGRVALERIEAGTHELVVQAPGFQPVITLLDVPESGLDTVVPLVPIRGALILRSNPGVRVLAVDDDGRRIELGTTDADGLLESRDLLRIGRYQLQLGAPDRVDVEQSVVLPLGRPAELRLSLPPKPGSLRLLTTPDGAQVDVSSESWSNDGQTPFEVEEVPAEVEVEVVAQLQGYRPLRKKLQLDANERRTVNLGEFVTERADLELRPGPVEVDPELLEVSLGDAGSSPNGGPLRWQDLAPGSYLLEARHPDFEPYRQELTLEDGDSLVYDLNLVPLPAELDLEVSGPESYKVSVFAGDQRIESGSGDRLRLPALKDLKVRVEAEEWMPVSEELRLQPAEQRQLSFAMEPVEWPGTGEDHALELNAEESIRFKWLQSGRFIMGSPESESGRYEWEGPQTRVDIEHGFWMAETPVTVGQFREFTLETGYRTDAEQDLRRGVRIWRNGQWEEGSGRSWQSVFAERSDYPVVGVSWRDAQAFVEWLNRRESQAGRLPPGYVYGLPSEAQWEYAARAGTQSRWSFGDRRQDLAEYAWFEANSGERVQPVAQKAPNPWGLYDMHGNVWEWTRSPWREQTGADAGQTRVYRGGSWINEANQTRSAHRLRSGEAFRSSILGFRVALVPE